MDNEVRNISDGPKIIEIKKDEILRGSGKEQVPTPKGRYFIIKKCECNKNRGKNIKMDNSNRDSNQEEDLNLQQRESLQLNRN